jgi:dihydropteroate synthase
MNKYSLRLRNRIIHLNRPLIMGILNLTDDSFFAPSRCLNPDALGKKMVEMVEGGADILDLGAMSSRPGSSPIPEALEKKRISEAMDIANSFVPGCTVSIDTYRTAVAAVALEKGADIINDISAASFHPDLPKITASYGAGYVLMHMKGTPETMQLNPAYSNTIAEVSRFFSEKIDQLQSKGIYEPILDPGFGFGKTLSHNFELLSNLNVFLRAFNLPLLIGVSRKKMIQQAAKVTVEQSLPGSLAAAYAAIEQGAHIIRVHDVPETKQIVAIRDQLCASRTVG